MAIDNGPQVVLGSEKRRPLISTDIFLLSSYVGAIKVSDALYKLSCCVLVSGPTMDSSPLAVRSSAGDSVGVRVGGSVSVAWMVADMDGVLPNIVVSVGINCVVAEAMIGF